MLTSHTPLSFSLHAFSKSGQLKIKMKGGFTELSEFICSCKFVWPLTPWIRDSIQSTGQQNRPMGMTCFCRVWGHFQRRLTWIPRLLRMEWVPGTRYCQAPVRPGSSPVAGCDGGTPGAALVPSEPPSQSVTDVSPGCTELGEAACSSISFSFSHPPCVYLKFFQIRVNL